MSSQVPIPVLMSKPQVSVSASSLVSEKNLVLYVVDMWPGLQKLTMPTQILYLVGFLNQARSRFITFVRGVSIFVLCVCTPPSP